MWFVRRCLLLLLLLLLLIVQFALADMDNKLSILGSLLLINEVSEKLRWSTCFPFGAIESSCWVLSIVRVRHLEFWLCESKSFGGWSWWPIAQSGGQTVGVIIS